MDDPQAEIEALRRQVKWLSERYGRLLWLLRRVLVACEDEVALPEDQPITQQPPPF